ncbi:MAG: hypothetical protein QM802_06340 [Agriterribacter sp.]
MLSKIPEPLLKYVPDAVSNAIKNMESVHIEADASKEKIHINALFTKKKNDLPLIKW